MKFLGLNNKEYKDFSDRKITLDLSESKVIADKGKKKVKVTLHCQAWAKNIDPEPTYLDGERPRGGAAKVLCFTDGKMKEAKGNNC